MKTYGEIKIEKEVRTKKLMQRLCYTKMQSKKHKYFGLVDELCQLRKNQMAIMDFLIASEKQAKVCQRI